MVMMAAPKQYFSISYPVTPLLPKNPKLDGKSNTPTNKVPSKAKKEIKVAVILGSGDEIYGKIQSPKSIHFQHYKNGLLYKKKITPQNIDFIKILRFKKKEISRSKSSIHYDFRPDKVMLVLKDKKKYYLDFLFSFLLKFKIDTSDGTTTLYSFFAGHFTPSKGWSGVESKDIDYHNENPHPRSVQKIKFIGIDL